MYKSKVNLKKKTKKNQTKKAPFIMIYFFYLITLKNSHTYTHSFAHTRLVIFF